MLRNKADNCSRTQNQKYNYASGRPASNNYRFGSQLVFISQLFPVGSNNVGSNSAIATGQISRSHQAVSNETTFRKVLGFALVGKETRISRWGWSSPSTNDSAVSFQGQRVFGVDALYGAPVQSGKSKDVVNDNFRFGNFDARIPKQQPGEKAEPKVDPDLGQQDANWFHGKRSSTDDRKDYRQNGYDFARAGSKQLGIHIFSFTQSETQVGAAL